MLATSWELLIGVAATFVLVSSGSWLTVGSFNFFLQKRKIWSGFCVFLAGVNFLGGLGTSKRVGTAVFFNLFDLNWLDSKCFAQNTVPLFSCSADLCMMPSFLLVLLTHCLHLSSSFGNLKKKTGLGCRDDYYHNLGLHNIGHAPFYSYLFV